MNIRIKAIALFGLCGLGDRPSTKAVFLGLSKKRGARLDDEGAGYSDLWLNCDGAAEIVRSCSLIQCRARGNSRLLGSVHVSVSSSECASVSVSAVKMSQSNTSGFVGYCERR